MTLALMLEPDQCGWIGEGSILANRRSGDGTRNNNVTARGRKQIMGIAITLAQYLVNGGIEYELVPHPHTQTAFDKCRSEPGACRMCRQSGRTQGRKWIHARGSSGLAPHPI
jgi:hypothetical protein